MFHVRITPQPAQLIELPEIYGDEVRVETDHHWIPSGTWMKCSDRLVKRLEQKLKHSKDDAQRDRVRRILELVQSVLDDSVVAS